MLSEEPAVANAEMICYASPNRLVRENEEYREYMSELHEEAMEILYPEDLDFSHEYDMYCYRSLDSDTNEHMNNLWSKLKIASAENDSDPTNIIALIVFAMIVILVAARFVIIRRRAKYY